MIHDADKRVTAYSKGMKARLNFIKALPTLNDIFIDITGRTLV